MKKWIEKDIKTKGAFDFVDITEDILSFVEKSKVEEGIVNIQIMHTSAALLLNENEPNLLKDIKKRLEDFAPKEGDYHHDGFLCGGDCDNGHSHCKAVILPSSITLNVIEGKLQLGNWQRIFFLELDKARERSYQVLVFD